MKVCFDCDIKFLCVYCINREHKHHKHDTIANQGALARTMFSSELNKIKVESTQSTIKYKDELEKITPLREQLEVELKERMLKKINEYVISLHTEKEKLMAQFDAEASKYKSDVKDLGLIEEDFDKSFSKYIDKVNAKTDFELIYERNEILGRAKTLSLPHCFTTTLGNDDETLLGLLECQTFTTKYLEDNDIIKLNYDKKYQDVVQKVKDLDNVIKRMKGGKKYFLLKIFIRGGGGLAISILLLFFVVVDSLHNSLNDAVDNVSS